MNWTVKAFCMLDKHMQLHSQLNLLGCVVKFSRRVVPGWLDTMFWNSHSRLESSKT